MNSDDPVPIAEHLVAEHGIDGAVERVRQGIAEAHANKDFYRLSVWREVRRALRDLQDAARGAPER